MLEVLERPPIAKEETEEEAAEREEQLLKAFEDLEVRARGRLYMRAGVEFKSTR